VYPSISKLKYKRPLKNHPKLTCIIGGKCEDGVVLVSDSKVTYYDHPPLNNQPKLHSDFYHIVTGGAGSTDLYNGFKTNALFATQPGIKIPETFRLEQLPEYNLKQPVQTSGVIHMYSNEYNFSSLQNNFGNLVKGINKSKYARDIDGSLEVLVATQIEDKGTAELTHITETAQSDVHDYRAIGSSGMYSYVFLKPFYLYESKVTMYKFAKIAYFIILFIEKYEIDTDVGGKPQIWFIPNSGELFTDKDRPEWIKEYETHLSRINDSFKQYILNEFL
jgi:20S proteasome alpha/beta subunit